MKNSEFNNPWALIIIGVIVFSLWSGSGWLIWNYVDVTERGILGDMFGAINALFSGLAFVGVIYAILLQKRELELQREELCLTRQELSGSREAQEKQVETLNISAELTALSTLAQYCLEYEDILQAKKSKGTYLVNGEDINEVITRLDGDKNKYISRMEEIASILNQNINPSLN